MRQATRLSPRIYAEIPRFGQKQENLNERMLRLQLAEAELEESFFRASGPGGQKTNKTLSGVSLLHLPTKIRVRCQRERSQGINRFLARRLLVEELEARQRGLTRHSAKAERLREEKDRKSGSRRKPVPTAAQHNPGAAEAKPTIFDFARAMEAYYLRPLTPGT